MVCQKHNHSSIPTSLLPINSWSTQLINSSAKSPSVLEPFVWFRFFQLFFTSSPSSHSIGWKFIAEEKRKKLISKLNALIDYHHKLWLMCEPNDIETNGLDDRLAKLYRAYILWLEDSQLHDVFVNIEELPPQFLKELLKSAIANIDYQDFTDQYINLKHIQTEVSDIYSTWRDLRSNPMFVENDINFDESIPEFDGESDRLISMYFSLFDPFKDEKPMSGPEVKRTNIDSFNVDIEAINNTSALLLLIQHNVRVVLEEAK